MLSKSSVWKAGVGLGLFTLLIAAPLAFSQDRDRDRGDRDRYWDQGRGLYTRLDPGTVIAVRTTQPIDVNYDRSDNRVYYGNIDQDVRGENGRIAVPRGSQAEMIVRVEPDNDLILDLESVVVNGERYAIRTTTNEVRSQRDNTIVGAIVGAINGGQARGQAVRIPRGSVVTFRLEQPLDMGVADSGVMRNGNHYHDWYRRDRDHR